MRRIISAPGCSSRSESSHWHNSEPELLPTTTQSHRHQVPASTGTSRGRSVYLPVTHLGFVLGTAQAHESSIARLSTPRTMRNLPRRRRQLYARCGDGHVSAVPAALPCSPAVLAPPRAPRVADDPVVAAWCGRSRGCRGPGQGRSGAREARLTGRARDGVDAVAPADDGDDAAERVRARRRRVPGQAAVIAPSRRRLTGRSSWRPCGRRRCRPCSSLEAAEGVQSQSTTHTRRSDPRSLIGPASMPQEMGPRVAISAIMACSPAQGRGGGKGSSLGTDKGGGAGGGGRASPHRSARRTPPRTRASSWAVRSTCPGRAGRRTAGTCG